MPDDSKAMVPDTGSAQRILGEAILSLERLRSPAGDLAACLVSMAMDQIHDGAGYGEPVGQ